MLNSDSDLISVLVKVGACEKYPLYEVDVILCNDLAGGKVFPSPIVTKDPVYDSYLMSQYPNVFPLCAVTRVQLRKYEKVVGLSFISCAYGSNRVRAISG